MSKKLIEFMKKLKQKNEIRQWLKIDEFYSNDVRKRLIGLRDKDEKLILDFIDDECCILVLVNDVPMYTLTKPDNAMDVIRRTLEKILKIDYEMFKN